MSSALLRSVAHNPDLKPWFGVSDIPFIIRRWSTRVTPTRVFSFYKDMNNNTSLIVLRVSKIYFDLVKRIW